MDQYITDVEKNLIITDSSKMAVYIAAALHGIEDDDGTIIHYDEIQEKKDKINDIAKKFFFKTRLKGVSTAVTWLSHNYLLNHTVKADVENRELHLPTLFSNETFLIEKNYFRRLIRKRGCSTVYFAFFPDMEADIAKDVIRAKIFKGTIFFDVKINNISKNAIKEAFNEPMTNVSLNGAVDIAIKRHLLTSNINYNLSAAIYRLTGRRLVLNQYVLFSLFLLKSREGVIHEDSYIIKASINVEGAYFAASCNNSLAYNEAKEMIRVLPTEAISCGFANIGLPKTSSLFKLYDHSLPEINIKKTARSLYEKGFISQPFTENVNLHAKSSDQDILETIHFCSNYGSSLHPIPPHKKALEILKGLKNEKHTAAHTSGITPKRGFLSLTEEESFLLEDICFDVIAALNKSDICQYEFRAGSLPLYAWVPVPMKNSLRLNRKWPVAYHLEPAETQVRYTPYTLIKELEEKEIGKPDIYAGLIQSLIESGLVDVSSGQLYLTSFAQNLFNILPVDENFTSLCCRWEKSLYEIEKGSSHLFSQLLQEVHSNLEKWTHELLEKSTPPLPSSSEKNINTVLKKNTDPSKQNCRPLPPAHKEDIGAENNVNRETAALCCPSCNNLALSLSGQKYICTSCGHSYNNFFDYGKYRILLRSSDIAALTRTGRTSLKIAKSEDGESLAGFIYLEDKNMAFTNEAQKKCPYCKGSLIVYSWGFSCCSCNFNVPFVIHEKKIDMKNLNLLLSGKTTDYIEDLVFSTGEKLSARLHIDESGSLKYYR